jgi:hypothetical protein
MKRDDMHELAIKQVHSAHMRMAEAHSVGDNRFEDRLQIEGGAANDFEHFSGSSLLLRCLSSISEAVPELRWRTLLDASRRLGVSALTSRVLASLRSLLERRRMAHPKAQDYAGFKVGLQQGFAPGEMGFNINLRNPERFLSTLVLAVL